MNTIYSLENINNYNKWYSCYYNHLKNMFNILIKNLKNRNIKYKIDNYSFDKFCSLIYNNSSRLCQEI